MVKNPEKQNNLIVYKGKNGSLELRGDFSNETVWASQEQIAQIFVIERSVITKHIRNIFKEGELKEAAVCAKFAHTAADGKTYQVQHYNLDAIISIGYRVNSKAATEFRKWATKILKGYLISGYALDKKFILKNYDKFLKTVADIQLLIPKDSDISSKIILDLVKEYSLTWTKLDAYDKDVFLANIGTKKKIKLVGNNLYQSILELKKELVSKNEATDLFANEKQLRSIEGIVGNVMQSFGGNDVYQTLEEKAAHLLYFIVKNHPFIDGNKRSGAFAFVWFLDKYKVRGIKNINPSGLTAITLLIAESDPRYKAKVVALVVDLLQVNK